MEFIEMKCLAKPPWTRRLGFTLVEILMVVAVMSTVTAGAVFTFSNVTRAAQNTKLQRDVRVINDAIRMYLINGGTFLRSDLDSPATVLAKLKKRASADSARELAGLRQSMADERLTYEMQSSADVENGMERARFVPDPARPRFVIQNSGPPGIRRFVLDPKLTGADYGTEERAVTMKLAKKDRWVWDYADAGVRRAEPGGSPVYDPGVTNPNPPDQGNITLNSPDFSIPGGTAPLFTYPKNLALLPTNPSGTAQILYSVNGGPFNPYSGPFTLDPGFIVTAVSVSLDPDKYDDSPSASRTYTTTPVTPSPALVFTKSGYDYFELGGEAASGTPPPSPSGSVSGTGLILNLLLIPKAYQNSSVFRYRWTYDGSDPLTSGGAQHQPDFSGGFSPAALPLPLDAFGTSSSATLKAAVKGENKAIVTDSLMITRTLNATRLLLRPPGIITDGRDVTLSLDVSARDMPKDARIYYTTDGTDPGADVNGNPQLGTLYTGEAFTLAGLTGTIITVKARVYAPLKYLQFFTTSAAGKKTLPLPAATEVYVGGNFVNPSGNAMRNIARLSNSGQVDTRFNTGSGASDDSLVGVVRQTGNGVVAGGDFDSLNGSARPGVVRLNLNGSVDDSFDADLSAN